MAPGASSQCVGAGASHLSKLDLNNSLPLDNCNERTPDVGNQYLVVMLLLEAKLPSNFTSSVIYIVFRIAQFTDNKTNLQNFNQVCSEIPKIPEIHSTVYHSIKNGVL